MTPPLTILPAPLCLRCRLPIFDMTTSRDLITDDLTVVLRCHGETETVHIEAATLAACPNIWTLGVLATAFEPPATHEPALGVAAGW